MCHAISKETKKVIKNRIVVIDFRIKQNVYSLTAGAKEGLFLFYDWLISCQVILVSIIRSIRMGVSMLHSNYSVLAYLEMLFMHFV